MKPSPTAWLVRAGHGAEHVAAFVAGGFVSISWASIPGLGDLRYHDDEEILIRLQAAQRGQPRADLRELLEFRDGISSGDVVVTPDTPTSDLLFGDVTAGYEFTSTPVVGDHHHVRDVRWLGRWNRDAVEQPLADIVRRYRRTVLRLPDQTRWLALAERVRSGDGEASEPGRQVRRPKRASRGDASHLPGRVCSGCGLTRTLSMFELGADICRDCLGG